jgi:hypothetical protein
MPAKVHSKKEELRRRIARYTQQLNSFNYKSEFVGKCKDLCGDLNPEVQHLPNQRAHLLNRPRSSRATVATSSAPWTLQQKLPGINPLVTSSQKQHLEL